jgi:NOL1/NOP2/fmu family ribosome biogenesis protein/23S rRNA U2552 (ribose-2'-O)-methylase RlmE/FtsJ
MFLGEVLNQYVKKDSIVLDMCAAPGGKSTLISQYLGEEGLLVSNEVVRQRVFILSENIQKWGNGNTVVTHNYAADFGNKLENLFDCILVDAPCSGEGMFRKDAGAVEEWSKKNVRECVARQCEILDEVWDALKPGGVLIYSTCTFNEEENEKNVQWIIDELGAEVLPVAHDASWGIVEGSVGYHFYPHKVKGEGLYMCALRKKGESGASFRIPKPKNAAPKTKIDGEAEMRSWLKHPDRWVIRQQERFMSAYPAKYKELIEYISTQFICISTGFGIGELRGKGVAPQHSLAMLKDLNKQAFVCAELSLDQALAYLRNEALVINGVAQGMVLVTYEGVPLGFVKNVGNRCNNLYPKEWRIRKL